MSMPSWKMVLTGAALVLLALLILIPAWLIGTATGTGFLLRTASAELNGLTLTVNQPRALFRGLSFSEVTWHSAGTLVEAKNVDLTLSYFCKKGFTLCIDKLALSQLDADIAASEDKPEEETAAGLPTIKTPFGVLIHTVDLGNISLKGANASEWTNNINWQASDVRFRKSQLNIGQSSIHNALFRHDLNGHIELSGAYPLAIEQSVFVKAPQLANPVDAAISLGNTVEQLAISVRTRSPDTLNIEAQLAPLAKVFSGELRLGLETLDPNTIMSVPLTELNGAAFAQFSIDPEAETFHIDARSDGLSITYRNVPYLLTTDINTDHSGVIHVDNLKLASNNTNIDLGATVQPFKNSDFADLDSVLAWLQTLDAKATVKADKLAELAENIGGSVNGTLNFSPDKPLAITANGAALALPGTRIKQLAVNGALPLDLGSEQALNLNIDSLGVISGNNSVNNARLEISGKYSAHQLSITADGEQFKADSLLKGALASDRSRWSGTLETLQATAYNPASDNVIRLQEATALLWRAEPETIRIAPACLAINKAKLCTSATKLSPQSSSVDFTLEHLAADSLQAWWPKDFNWDGKLAGKGSLRKTGDAAPVLALTLDGGAGSFSSTVGDKTITQPYQGISISADAKAENFAAKLNVPREGQSDLLQGQVNLSGTDFSKLQGALNLSSFDLAVIAGLVPEAEIVQGILDIKLQLSGDVKTPIVGGTMALADGRLRLRDNPSDLQNLRLQGKFQKDTAIFDGSFTLGEGNGQLEGQFALSPPVKGQIRLWGENLEIESPPMIKLATTMDVNIGIDPDIIKITGDIAVPSGKITVAELPESAQSLSSDVKIVDSHPDAQATSKGPNMVMDLIATIGPDLSFKGFGASTKLKGKLKLEQTAGNPLQGTGAIDLVDGRYRGYGQKLDVRTGRLLFNDVLSSPNIELEAIRTIGETVAGIKVSGPAQSPEITPFSEPAMSNSDTLYAIVTGKLPDDDSRTDKGAVVAQAMLAGGLALGGGGIASGAEKLGISNFSIGSGDDTDLSVSGYLREDVFMEYGVNALGDGSVFKVRWDFAKRLSLEMINSLHSSLDLLYSRSF
ncbi:MAG: hypothetical protein CSA53_04560 [Gammaproteobacteria bacterium]|nr:MAG: hypothetical protein CSA53_04560 [Gammaproteobacteria bacterium]